MTDIETAAAAAAAAALPTCCSFGIRAPTQACHSCVHHLDPHPKRCQDVGDCLPVGNKHWVLDTFLSRNACTQLSCICKLWNPYWADKAGHFHLLQPSSYKALY
ncbi:MAG: hypothetical protein FRX49_10182 [Trebouxia sp. A1-2]|nr:MAG: hypothetical protein FRX49_10182 [Trebouxia sp. A1-2]